jgi:hypothetical protein
MSLSLIKCDIPKGGFMKQLFLILSLALMFGFGWFSKSALQPTTLLHAAPGPGQYYRVLNVPSENVLEQTLNNQATQGWKLHSIVGGGGSAAMILERR